jgi:hypothetical protein
LLKAGAEPADEHPMSTHPQDLTWTQSTEPIQVLLDDDTDYTSFGDEELSGERDRQRQQLDELSLHPGSSPAVTQLRASIEREVGRMNDELKRRARSRHPSSRGMSSRLRSVRSVSWPPHTDSIEGRRPRST